MLPCEAAGPWMARLRTSNKKPDWPTRLRHHRGVLLFGYFLLDKQEKVTCCRSATDIKIPASTTVDSINKGLWWAMPTLQERKKKPLAGL